MPSTFEINLTKAAGDTKTYKTKYDTLKAEVKARAGNYENAVAMIYAAQDQIRELKQKIQKNDFTVLDEMKKWQANYPAIYARMKPASDEVAKLKKSLADLKPLVAAEQKIADQLNKEAPRAAMTDVKKASESLKLMLEDLKKMTEGIPKQEKLLTDLPKEANGLFV